MVLFEALLVANLHYKINNQMNPTKSIPTTPFIGNPAMKKLMVILAFFMVAISSYAQEKKDLFYYESISNPSKTVNFVIGFYPSFYSFDATINNNEGASTVKMAIINNSSDDYVWKNYRIIVQLSTGETFTNYTTSTAEGQYSCKYIVAGKETHYQYLCFHKQFDPKKITKVFLMIDDAIFELANSNE